KENIKHVIAGFQEIELPEFSSEERDVHVDYDTFEKITAFYYAKTPGEIDPRVLEDLLRLYAVMRNIDESVFEKVILLKSPILVRGGPKKDFVIGEEENEQ